MTEKAEDTENRLDPDLWHGKTGLRHGVTPLWASEIEPFPIAVTKYHLKCANEELDTY